MKYRVTIWQKAKVLNSETIIASVIIESKNRTGILLKGKEVMKKVVKFNSKKHDITFCESDILNFSRTKKAIEKYDIEDKKFMKLLDSSDDAHEIEIGIKILDEWARLVGIAYGTDTITINTRTDCEKYIRPGPKVPPPGAELSPARKMVQKWENE